MPPSLSELKVLPSYCFAFKIPDDVAVTSNDVVSRIYEFTNIFVLNDQLVSRIFCHYESTRLNIVIFHRQYRRINKQTQFHKKFVVSKFVKLSGELIIILW